MKMDFNIFHWYVERLRIEQTRVAVGTEQVVISLNFYRFTRIIYFHAHLHNIFFVLLHHVLQVLRIR